MGKIKKIVNRIDSTKWFEFEVWYNTKNSFYIKGGYPDEIKKYVSDLRDARFEKLEELEHSITAVIEKYKINTRTSRNVIIVYVSIGHKNIQEIKSEHKNLYHGDLSSSINGYGMSFNFQLATEFGSKENNNTSYKNIYIKDGEYLTGYTDIHPNSGAAFIPFTPDNYQFCLNMAAMTNNLSEQIINFFGDKSEIQLLKAIRTNGIKAISQNNQNPIESQ